MHFNIEFTPEPTRNVRRHCTPPVNQARSSKIKATAWNRGRLPMWWIETPIPFTKPMRFWTLLAIGAQLAALAQDPEKWAPVFHRDKRKSRLRGDHAQTMS